MRARCRLPAISLDPASYAFFPYKVSYEPENAIEAVVKAMPSAVQVSNRATNLGLVEDAGAFEMVDEYVKSEWQR